jgi:hypothetical protein
MVRPYDELPAEHRTIVSEAFKATCANLRVNGCVDLPMDDRAEKLVDAISEYFVEARLV